MAAPQVETDYSRCASQPQPFRGVADARHQRCSRQSRQNRCPDHSRLAGNGDQLRHAPAVAHEYKAAIDFASWEGPHVFSVSRCVGLWQQHRERAGLFDRAFPECRDHWRSSIRLGRSARSRNGAWHRRAYSKCTCSYTCTPTPAPAPAPALAPSPAFAPEVPIVATAPLVEPDHPLTSFSEGLARRTEYENWITTLPVAIREGALWWAGERSKRPPRSCPSTHSAEFLLGCQAAKEKLAPLDRRRLSDPEFRRGWNSFVG